MCTPGFEAGLVGELDSAQGVATLPDLDVGHLSIHEMHSMLLTLLQQMRTQLSPADTCICSPNLPTAASQSEYWPVACKMLCSLLAVHTSREAQ